MCWLGEENEQILKGSAQWSTMPCHWQESKNSLVQHLWLARICSIWKAPPPQWHYGVIRFAPTHCGAVAIQPQCLEFRVYLPGWNLLFPETCPSMIVLPAPGRPAPVRKAGCCEYWSVSSVTVRARSRHRKQDADRKCPETLYILMSSPLAVLLG